MYSLNMSNLNFVFKLKPVVKTIKYSPRKMKQLFKTFHKDIRRPELECI